MIAWVIVQFVALDSGRHNEIVIGKENCVKGNPFKRSMQQIM